LFIETEDEEMLIGKGIPKEKINVLKRGDFFVDSPIVSIQKKCNLVSIITEAGSVFNAHHKPHSYNLFKKKTSTLEDSLTDN
jgi:hypothetical protein